jgi:hypothetical protein
MNDSKDSHQNKHEQYFADFVWQGSIYRLEINSNNILSKNDLTEKLQCEYPGAIVHNIYPSAKKSDIEITSAKRYNPSKMEWV